MRRFASAAFIPSFRPPPAPTTQHAAPHVAGKGSAAQVFAAARAIPNAISRKCSKCNGKGEITVRVQSGVDDPDAFIQRPVFHDETKKCDKCNGKKTERSSDEDIKRLVSNLVQSIATLNLNDKRAQASLSEGYTVLTKTIIGDKRTWLLIDADLAIGRRSERRAQIAANRQIGVDSAATSAYRR